MTCEADVRAKYREITLKLIRKGLEISAMESCTGGMLASLITDTEGSSAVIKGAYVTYSNGEKIRLGVPAETISRFSVYSEETAAAMAEVCMRDFGSDIGIGVTGTTGNRDPENEAASVPGQVFFAVAYGGETRAFAVTLPPLESRHLYKLAAADAIADKISEIII